MPVLPMYEFDYYTNTSGSILREERANEDAKIQLDVDTHRHVCREETHAMLSSPSPSPRRSFATSYSALPSSTPSAFYASDLARPSTTRTYTSTSSVTRPSDYYYPAASTARTHYEQGYADGLTGSPRRYY